mmetsp:Transcript_46434/g.140617  ORF Transcript_46434/g.140617 Transcript_46434/m.140617 type:complete len:238 (-) Transcript_46434:4691-5404(-)
MDATSFRSVVICCAAEVVRRRRCGADAAEEIGRDGRETSPWWQKSASSTFRPSERWRLTFLPSPLRQSREECWREETKGSSLLSFCSPFCLGCLVFFPLPLSQSREEEEREEAKDSPLLSLCPPFCLGRLVWTCCAGLLLSSCGGLGRLGLVRLGDSSQPSSDSTCVGMPPAPVSVRDLSDLLLCADILLVLPMAGLSFPPLAACSTLLEEEPREEKCSSLLSFRRSCCLCRRAWTC